MLRRLEIHSDDIQLGDLLDIADEPARGARFEIVSARNFMPSHVHVFLFNIGFPVALLRDEDVRVTVLRSTADDMDGLDVLARHVPQGDENRSGV